MFYLSFTNHLLKPSVFDFNQFADAANNQKWSIKVPVVVTRAASAASSSAPASPSSASSSSTSPAPQTTSISSATTSSSSNTTSSAAAPAPHVASSSAQNSSSVSAATWTTIEQECHDGSKKYRYVSLLATDTAGNGYLGAGGSVHRLEIGTKAIRLFAGLPSSIQDIQDGVSYESTRRLGDPIMVTPKALCPTSEKGQLWVGDSVLNVIRLIDESNESADIVIGKLATKEEKSNGSTKATIDGKLCDATLNAPVAIIIAEQYQKMIISQENGVVRLVDMVTPSYASWKVSTVPNFEGAPRPELWDIFTDHKERLRSLIYFKPAANTTTNSSSALSIAVGPIEHLLGKDHSDSGADALQTDLDTSKPPQNDTNICISNKDFLALGYIGTPVSDSSPLAQIDHGRFLFANFSSKPDLSLVLVERTPDVASYGHLWVLQTFDLPKLHLPLAYLPLTHTVLCINTKNGSIVASDDFLASLEDAPLPTFDASSLINSSELSSDFKLVHSASNKCWQLHTAILLQNVKLDTTKDAQNWLSNFSSVVKNSSVSASSVQALVEFLYMKPLEACADLKLYCVNIAHMVHLCEKIGQLEHLIPYILLFFQRRVLPTLPNDVVCNALLDIFTHNGGQTSSKEDHMVQLLVERVKIYCLEEFQAIAGKYPAEPHLLVSLSMQFAVFTKSNPIAVPSAPRRAKKIILGEPQKFKFASEAAALLRFPNAYAFGTADGYWTVGYGEYMVPQWPWMQLLVRSGMADAKSRIVDFSSSVLTSNSLLAILDCLHNRKKITLTIQECTEIISAARAFLLVNPADWTPYPAFVDLWRYCLQKAFPIITNETRMEHLSIYHRLGWEEKVKLLIASVLTHAPQSSTHLLTHISDSELFLRLRRALLDYQKEQHEGN